MNFLSKHMWTIYGVLKEENRDGDNFKPDLTAGLALFVAALEGRKDTDYACMKDVDKPAVLAEWEANYPVIKNQYDALVLRDGPANRMKELAEAFQAGDREKFSAVLEDGLAAMEPATEEE